MALPKVSIIVPIYNVEAELPRCLDSLIAQTLHDIEIILIDDGSPDNCGEICDEYAKTDLRIKVIHQKNEGAASARNAGLEISTGEYIGFCDPDDYIENTFFEELFLATQKTNSDIVKGNATELSAGEIYSLGPDSDSIKKNRAYFSYSFWSAIYKRSFLEKNKIDFPHEVITGHDVIFLTKAVCLANHIELVDTNSNYVHCQREGSLDSQNLSDIKIQSKILCTKKIFDFINEINLDYETYGIIYKLCANHMLFSVYKRNSSIFCKASIIRFIITSYKECKNDNGINKQCLEYIKNENEIGLLLYLTPKTDKELKIFGFIPIFKIKNEKLGKEKWLLFNYIPILRITRKGGSTHLRLFGCITFITLSRSKQK